MKEYTVITTVEFTEIIYSEDDFDQEEYKKNFVDQIFIDEIEDPFNYYFDKIDIKSCKGFPREVNDDAE